MFECSLYTELIKILVGHTTGGTQMLKKIKELFASEDKVMLQNLAMYIAKGFELRNNKLHPH